MPKTIKNVFDKKLDYIKLYEAYRRASYGKYKRRDVLAFEIDLETNLMNLYNAIKNNNYKMGDYHEFIIYEPKKRVIKSLPFIDRIVHQWYVEEFIIPYFVPKFIKDTYACLKDRGTHKAVLKTQEYMRKMKRKYNNYYVLKCDIKKYFYSIDKNILYSILKRYISDQKLLEFTKLIIFDEDSDVGIPIGNYTSQYFANIYLNELDHYIKEKLQIKYYVRYMDDFVLLVENKEKAKLYKELISNFLELNLKLKLNEKSKYYPNNLGVDFCGYRIFETHLLLRNRSKKKIKKNINKWNSLGDKRDLNQILMEWNSWIAHASFASTYNMRRKYLNKIEFDNNFDI